ncbi:hypothetical protein [Bacillus sp. CGMCC 1.16541]|uniref:hypothetical protein n=1 Tax=Bacillus sp. CGMCC 1.16541 TaxID=2185143 RepID=UPI000D73CDA4|nr:hypothetical protein [Bacillus sp. CGMCC 1.16541]
MPRFNPGRVNMFFEQQQEDVNLSFNNETTVLTLPVRTEVANQPVKVDGNVKIEARIPLGLTNYQYGVQMRIKRNGTTLTTETLQQGAAAVLTVAFTQFNSIPFTWVDFNTVEGMNTYTVTLQFFVRSSSGVNVTAQSRSINAIT